MNPESGSASASALDEASSTAHAPSMGGVKRQATDAEWEAVPSHLVAERMDGELYVSPRPAPRHAWAQGALHDALYKPFVRGRGGPGGWLLLFEPELHLSEDILIPDLAGWRRERMPELPDESAITLAPDWVCEVLSPSTASLDRDKKMSVYAREAVRHVWLVDPLQQRLEVYGLDDGRWASLGTHGGQVRVRAEPFTPLLLELGALWAR